MAELADALVSGISGKPCRFESCYPHQKGAVALAVKTADARLIFY